MTNFWEGFFKRAIEEKAEDETPAILHRTVSAAGPELDKLTLESDRDKYRTWRG